MFKNRVLTWVVMGLTVSHVIAQPKQSEINKPFLKIEGKTLTNQIMTLPHDFNQNIALVAVGFSRKSQADFETWIPTFKKRYKENPKIVVLEIPMMGPTFKWVRAMIEKGMRKGIPEENHDSVMLFYGDVEPYRTYYRWSEKYKSYMMLVDHNGRVIWQAGGASNAEQLRELFEKTDRAIHVKSTHSSKEAIKEIGT